MGEGVSQLKEWCSHFGKLIGEYLELTVPFLLGGPDGGCGISQKHQWLLRQLATSCHMSSESALLLVGAGRLWDAEVITRAVTEGSLKFVFLCVGKDHEIREKVEEYWEILPDIASLKTHQRIKDFLELVENPDADLWKAFRDLLLSEEIVDRIRTNYSRRTRKQVQQKWAFMEVIKSLSNLGISGFDGFIGLAFGFGMSSHQIHKDAESTGMIWDRLQRSPQRKKAVEIAHGARIISDLSAMAMLRTLMVFRLYDVDRSPVVKLRERFKWLLDELTQAQAEWHAIEYGRNAIDAS